MWYLIITIVTFIVSATITAINKVKKEDISFYAYACGFIGGITFVLFWNNDTPTSMDVYQGKTTLEITYRDGVPVDSIVVFKNKEK